MNEWDVRSFDWPILTSESVVFEIGGYKGRWALEIAQRYEPYLYVFEPQPWAYEICRTALADFPRARVFPFGLGDRAGGFPMGDFETDGASFLKSERWCRENKRQAGEGEMRDVREFVRRERIQQIDLMLVNVEGYEYRLIPYMLAGGVKPVRLIYQGHERIDSHLMTDTGLRLFLNEGGYHLLWDYGPTLSAWEWGR